MGAFDFLLQGPPGLRVFGLGQFGDQLALGQTVLGQGFPQIFSADVELAQSTQSLNGGQGTLEAGAGNFELQFGARFPLGGLF